MHGLAAHGASGAPGATSTVTSLAAPDHPGAGVSGAHAADTRGPQFRTTGAEQCASCGDGPDHGGHSLAVGLRLALLMVAFALVVTSMASRRRRRSTSSAGLSSPRWSEIVARARPPDLIALGVCRC